MSKAWLWDWGTLIGYIAMGFITGRFAAREAYRWTREEWPSLVDGAKTGIGEATVAFIVTLFFWPVVALLLTVRWTVARSIPEYRIARNEELSAELDRKIRDQQAEIKRLGRQIEGWKP